MGMFTEEQLEVAITQGIRAFHALKGIDVHFPTVDPLIVSEVTKKVVALIEKAAAEPDADEPSTKGTLERDYPPVSIDRESLRGALARAYCAPKNRTKELDSDLLVAAEEELVALMKIGPAAEPLLQGEAIVLEPSDFQIGVAAYELAIKHPNSAWGMDYTHKIAAEIGAKLHQGFRPEEQNHIVQTITVRIEPDTTAFQKAIDDIFGNVEWRREGWNDAKAVMVRALTRQIKHPDDDSYMLRNFRQRDLELVRKFIASFQFDPNHEQPKKS